MKIKQYLVFVLSIIIGLFFIFSAYLKLNPIEILELKIVDTRMFSWTLSSFVARLLISMEFMLGLLFTLNINYRKKLYQFTLVIIFIFTIYLQLL